MAVRTITVTEQAYRRLRSHKGASESFTDVVLRLTERRPLTDFAGIVSHETAKALRSAVEEDRRQRQRRDE